nr:MAG TPA: hypothetical protein [Caudoviricetes sp.]
MPFVIFLVIKHLVLYRFRSKSCEFLQKGRKQIENMPK